MKKQPRLQLLLVSILLGGIFYSNAQNITTPDPNPIPFDVVPNSTFTVNGELKLIGNAIVGPNQSLRDENGVNRIYTPNDDYNGPESNSRKVFGYIDIDQDPTTFSSSSADFISANTGCAKIAYAGLYWSASYYTERTNNDGTAADGDFARYQNLQLLDNRPDFRTVKFKPPGVSNYIDILPANTTVIFDGYRNTSTNPNDIAVQDIPYVCYADVTDIVKGLSDPEGTYTVANMRATIGRSANNSSGISGGWTLVLVYEDLNLPTSYISTNQGFLEVSADNSNESNKTFTYTGFRTVPAPLPVNARYGVAALEGDFDLRGDQLQILNTNDIHQSLSTVPANPADNFFDSSISVDGNFVTSRVPASRNTLGLDIDIFNINNINNEVIGNDQTSVEFRITTNLDRYRLFLNTFQVEVIEPKLAVEKRVLDTNENDITGGDVTLNDVVIYELKVENIGNEDLTNTSIKISLPQEVDFTGNNVTADPGINYFYDSLAREFTLTLDNNIVERFDGPSFFRYRANITSDCFSIVDSCQGEIESFAFSSYTGEASSITITGEQNTLGRDNCNIAIAGSVNVLVDLTLCNDVTSVSLCNGSVNLVAQDGFTSYEWIDVNNPDVILGGNQIFTTTQPGLYQVTKSGNSDCQNTTERFEVTSLDVIDNPIITIVENLENNPVATGNIKVCPTTGGSLPEIFLCGAGASIDLDSGFVNALEVSWERLDPFACPSVNRDPNCPTTDPICEGDWVTVGNETVFTASQAGEYRIQVNLDGGCIRTFYFDVFQNNFDPQLVVVEQITCGNPGILQVANASNQYEYQLESPDGSISPYQTDSLFNNIIIPGTYNINARSIGGAEDSCIFSSNTVIVEEIDILVAIEKTDPICLGDLGNVQINITNSVPPFIYHISSTDSGNPFSDSFGPTTEPNHVFSGLFPGVYDVEVSSFDGDCSYRQTIIINEPNSIQSDAYVLSDVRCNGEESGEVMVNVTGGIPPYEYSFKPTGGITIITNITDETQFIFPGLPAGAYQIIVRDGNYCESFSDIIISEPQALTANTTVNQQVNGADGVIEITTTGGTPPYQYSLDGNVFNTTNTFTGLVAGVYSVTVRDSNDCEIVIQETIDPLIEPIAVTLDLENANVLCFGDNSASVTSTVTGGTGEYTYSIQGTDYTGFSVALGPQNDALFSDLRAGTYEYIVSDSEFITFTVAQAELLVINIESTDKSCGDGNPDGLITVTATGGTPPYEYTLSNSGNIIETILTNDPQVTFLALASGSYNVSTQDSNGCEQTVNVSISEPTPISLDLDVTPITNDSDGKIEVTAMGGTPPYTYALKDTQTNSVITTQTSNVFNIGTSGDYTVTVTDTGNCVIEQFVRIESTAQNPILEYADEIFFCAITGQVYPTIAIEDVNGEAIDLAFTDVVSVVWQKLNDINCDIELEDNCPTTDSSCTSDWFNLCTTLNCDITDPGEYRIVIEFAAKSVDRIQTYYFKTEKKTPDVAQSFKMYPNPTRGIVKLNKEPKIVKVFDTMGKMVLQTTESSYDISSLRNGVYFVEVITITDEKIISKLIKK
ncbi:T9SS type A sorting domain-containing protein [Aquimarina celericrescens]|uniref:T9SS type A sorting domain-containing protein n=1 Tax=Aquimarina celericrescens TaxID=1964542 RepID=A0ABW5ATD8_9FLAO|nr:T9SS type A sorting domain-containing protein [Aquimarina celericrescens]